MELKLLNLRSCVLHLLLLLASGHCGGGPAWEQQQPPRDQVSRRFYESLGENEREDRRMLLRSMAFDYDNNQLYVGAVNRVYALSPESLENVSDSYKSSPDRRPDECLSSESCEVDLHDYSQLVVPAGKILLACGTARKGQCVKLFSNPLKETTNPLGYHLASTDRFSVSFGFLGPQDSLVVATSHRSGTVDADGKMFHHISSWANQNSRHVSLDLLLAHRGLLTVDFKGGFIHDGVNYFFSNRSEGNIKKGPYISRMCSSHPDTFVEFRLSCKGSPQNTADKSLIGKEFDELIQVKFLPPSNYLENPDSLHNVNGMVFALFSRRLHKEEESALCIYNMTDIEEGILDAVNSTLTGKNTEKIYESSNPSSAGTVTIDSFLKNSCSRLYQHSPISAGATVVKAAQLLSLGGQKVTSVAVRKDDHVMTYVGTLDGKIYKFKINSTPQPVVQLPLGRQPFPIKDLLILSKDELFALTKKEVLKIKTFDCSGVETCSECVSDNHCGWCMSTQRCTESASACPIAQHYLYDTCVNGSVTPVNSSRKVSMFKFRVSSLPSSHEKILCRYDDPRGRLPTLQFNTTPEGLEFGCPLIQDQWEEESLSSVNPISLSLIVDGTTWAMSIVNVISCHKANSCLECTGMSCLWDASDFRCLDAPSAGAESKCPRLRWEGRVKSLMTHSGEAKSHSLSVDNMPDSYKDIRCRFSWPSKVGSAAEVRGQVSGYGTKTVTCLDVQFEYPEGISSKNATLDLLTPAAGSGSSLKTFLTTTVQVYKCRSMAQNCGQCQSLDGSFSCLWCANQCEYRDRCKSGTSAVGKQDVCTDVAITSFRPTGGPVRGNTTITVVGRNFGLRSELVRVSVDKSPCQDIVIHSTDRLTCKTTKGSFQGPLTFTRNSVIVKSTQLFQYKDPVIVKMEPVKGLVSGGTRVTLSGHNFDHGNSFNVSLGGQQLPILSRSPKDLIFQTLPVPQKMPVQFVFSVDGSSLVFIHQFDFLEDPVIETFENPFTISHGGTPVIFKGSSFSHLSSARLIVYLPDETNRTGEPCKVKESRLSCPTPDLSDTNIKVKAKLHFGILGCSVKRWLHLTRPDANFTLTPLKTLAYYETPEVSNLPEVMRIRPEAATPQFVDIRSSNDDLLKRFKDLSIIVGGQEVKDSEPGNPLRFQLPHFYELESKAKNNDIVLKVGNFRKVFGKFSLSSRLSIPRLVGIIVGLVLGFATVVVVAYFIFRCCKMKHKAKRPLQVPYTASECNVSIPNLREVSTRGDPKAINPYSQAMPGSNEEMMPLVRGMDDENYFQNIIQSLDVLPEEGSDIYIPREKLQLGNLIGRGNFGSVYVATLTGPDEARTATVAVKMIDDPDMKEKAVENFVREGLMMKKFDHPNVMSLHGLCVGYRKEPMVILPYMVNGDLRSYVKDSNRQFTARELLRLTHQVAQGMTYLSSLKFIHRDLAARNCMIDECQVVKVADFGLSHELHEKNYYSSKDQKAKLPIKWMALESLESFIFTTKSDVWSFGVLMWEVMTRGVTPYPDVEIFETRDYLASGRRLRKPKYCPENVYDIMMRCWSEMPDQRPTFTDLVNEVELILNPPPTEVGSSPPEFNYLNQVEMQEGTENYLRPV